MSKAQCPLGEDCDLTLAWMMGAERAKDTIKAQAAEIERLRAALRGAEGQMAMGNMNGGWRIIRAALEEGL